MVRPFALSIAGSDPSGGAGVIADCKTFEAHKVYGLSVITAITFQNEKEFDGLEWIGVESIQAQIKTLAKIYPIKVVKIGLIESLEVLDKVLQTIRDINPNAKVIWDPIISATAGFVFHANPIRQKFEEMCKKVFLVTPNIDEINILYPGEDPIIAGKQLAENCHVLLKGGHSEKEKGRDHLFENGKQWAFATKVIADFDKHGTGCVLSSAIAANLAKGNSLRTSCLRSKKYVSRFLQTNKTRLGYHKL